MGDGTYSIGPAASIAGNLQILGPGSSSRTTQVFGSSVRRNFLLQYSGTAAPIGSATGCPNSVGRNLQVLNDAGRTTIDSKLWPANWANARRSRGWMNRTCSKTSAA
ncbi:MAG: hypothetical protein ACLPPV_03470 [Candidatus Korobacteraceae bacterium]|jgi:hypothetical protein